MTALCGLAQSFTQLVLARIGVGIGEAGSSPPSHAIIADLYPREERAGAMGIFSLGVALGGMLATLLGGLVAHEYGWRAALLIAGLPGLVLAVIIRFMLPNPPRRAAEIFSHTQSAPPSVLDGFRAVLASPAMCHVIAGVTLVSFLNYGKTQWTMSFFVRSHGLDTGEASLIIAPLQLLGIGGGALLGGWLADRLSRRDLRWTAWIIVLAQVLSLPFWVYWYLTDDLRTGVAAWGCALVLTNFYVAPSFAMVQSLAPPRARATCAAIMLLILNLVGLGLGPQLVGISSDWLAEDFGAASLRYTLAGGSFVALWGAYHYWRGGAHYARELAAPAKN